MFKSDVYDFEYKYRNDEESPYLRSKYASIQNIRDMVFMPQIEIEGSDAHTEFKNSMQKFRWMAVNFNNIDGVNRIGPEVIRRPATVEFRLHAGTFDAIEIGHWAYFCAALLRLCFEVAETAEHDEDVLPDVTDWDSRILLDDLLNMMPLPRDTQAYYERKRRDLPSNEELYWRQCDESGDVAIDFAEEQSDYEDEEDIDMSQMDDDARADAREAERDRMVTKLGWKRY